MSGSEGATKQLSQLSLSDSANLERGASRKVQNDALLDSDLDLSRHAADPHAGASGPAAACDVEGRNIEFVDYQDESQLPAVMSLVGRDLSEPYSIFTYRYFLYRFPNLCILAVDQVSKEPIGCVVAKIDMETSPTTVHPSLVQEDTVHPSFIQKDSSYDISSERDSPGKVMTGYIGMLAVSQPYRRRGVGKALVEKVIGRMRDIGCSSVTLETEVTNLTAQRLYQDIFGFVREELLVRYYLNWNDAYRLRLWFSSDGEERTPRE